MKKYTAYILSTVIGLLFTIGSVYAVTVFNSQQLAPNPSNGNCLTTNGGSPGVNSWSASCGGGGSGSSIRDFATTTDTLSIYNNWSKLFGFGTSTPWALLSVNPNALGNVPEFVIGSSSATHFYVDGTGNIGIGTTSPTSVNTNGHLVVSGTNSQDVNIYTTNVTTNSDSVFNAYSDTARTFLGSHGSAQVSSRYGITLGGWGEITEMNGMTGNTNGLIVGTNTATPLVFGTNNMEVGRFLSGGNFGIGTTSAGSLLSIGNSGGINIIPTATSTFGSSAQGINILKGCFAIAGTCVGAGSGTVTSVGLSSSNSTLTIGNTPVTTSGTITADLNLTNPNTWTGLQKFFANASTTGLSANYAEFGSSATTTFTATGRIGIGTTTPGSLLSIGNIGGINISPTATSTWGSSANGINITNGCFAIAGVCVGGSGGGSGTVTSVTAGAGFQNQGLTITTSGTLVGAFATSTTPVLGNIPYFTGIGDATNPAKFGTVGTSTPTVTSPITYSGTLGSFVGGASGAFGCATCLTSGAVVTVAQGGTNATTFAPNSVVVSNSAGTTLIATGTQLTVGNLIASTTANNLFYGNVLAPIALVGSPSFSFSADTDTGMYSTGANTLDFSTGGVRQMTLTSAGALGIGTTTPWASMLSINAPSQAVTTPYMVIGSSTATAFGVYPASLFGSFSTGSTTPFALFTGVNNGSAGALIALATSTAVGSAMPVFMVDKNGHLLTSGPKPALSSCGSSPTVVGNDFTGLITIGSGVQTTCTVTFAVSYGTAPNCTATDDTSVLAVKSPTTASAMTLGSATTFGSDTISYICIGTQ